MTGLESEKIKVRLVLITYLPLDVIPCITESSTDPVEDLTYQRLQKGNITLCLHRYPHVCIVITFENVRKETDEFRQKDYVS